MLKNEETCFIGCGCFVPQHNRKFRAATILKVFSFLSGLGNVKLCIDAKSFKIL